MQVLAAGELKELTVAQGKRLRPALLLEPETEQGRTLIFDMDRSGRKTLGDMKETVGKQGYNPDFNKHYDNHVAPVIATLERAHGRALATLARRRHLQRTRADEERDSKALAKKTTSAYVKGLEERELQQAVLRIRGNRLSFNRYLRDRRVRCMESNAEAAARRAGRTQKWRSRAGSIDSITFSDESFSENFELGVGCTMEAYAAQTAPAHLADLRAREGEEAFVRACQGVQELRARKGQYVADTVLAGITGEIGLESVGALQARLAPGATEEVTVSLSAVARSLGGPLMVGARADGSAPIRPNAGQCLKDVLRKYTELNTRLLGNGRVGYHETRRGYARVQVGGVAVRVAQAPSAKQVAAQWQMGWIQSGLVRMGRPIIRWVEQWVPGADGELVLSSKDMSGRLLPKAEAAPPLLEAMRERDALGSMPDFTSMPMAHVERHLQRAGFAPVSSTARQRARHAAVRGLGSWCGEPPGANPLPLRARTATAACAARDACAGDDCASAGARRSRVLRAESANVQGRAAERTCRLL